MTMTTEPRSLREVLALQNAPWALKTTVERMIVEQYQIKTSPWREYCIVDTVPDFNEVDRMVIQLEGDLERIKEFETYPELDISSSTAKWRVYKYGAMLHVSWEMIVNDDQRRFRQLSQGFGRLAEVAEAKFVQNILESIPVTNDLDGNPLTGALDEALIKKALNVFGERQEARGLPYVARPAIAVTAFRNYSDLQTLLRPSTALDYNPLAGSIPRIIDEPYIVNKAAIYIIAEQNLLPGVEVDFLKVPRDGRDDYSNGPRVMVDSFNAITDQPGDVGTAGEGFKYDSIAYKIRHVFGGALVNSAAIVKLTRTS